MLAHVDLYDREGPNLQQTLPSQGLPSYLSLFKAENDLIKRQKLATGRTIDLYSDMVVVADPHVGTLDETSRFALIQEIESQMAPATIDFASICDRLQEHLAQNPDQCSLRHQERPQPFGEPTTIGPVALYRNDSKAQSRLQRAHNKEARNRARLIDAGCPPCLPENHQFVFPYGDSTDTLPYEYPAAMFYLQGGHSVYDRPLDAQYADWTSFRRYQQDIRDDFVSGEMDPQAAISEYMRSSREKMHARNWTEAATLINWQLDVSQQNALQNWLEFMVNHLDDNAGLRLSAQQRLDDAINENDREWQRDVDDRRISLHEKYLQWMEEQRVSMSVDMQATESVRCSESNTTAAVPSGVTIGKE